MKKIFLNKIIIFLALAISVLPAHAQIIDSSFYRWTIYELQNSEDDEKKCYMINYPINTDSNHNYRDKSYIMVTRYQNRRIEEFSLVSGFEYKENGKVLILIDDEKFQLTTNKDIAWARSKDDDIAIIQKLLESQKLQARADSSIATFAIDEYSLEGVAKAYNRLKRVCR